MGGNSSKDSTSHGETTISDAVEVHGLKTGDVVTVNGEAFAGGNKLLMINFLNHDDIAFHFKVIMLEAEGLNNKVKMNTRTNGKWGPEEFKDNLIFLNHFFELKFTCLQDKFSVNLDGIHFCDYKHRVSPDKITKIEFSGDASWNSIDVPGKVKNATNNSDIHSPTEEEVKQFVQSLGQSVYALRAETNETEYDKFAQLIRNGLEITKTMLEEEKGSFLKDLKKYGGYLQDAFSAGSAIYGAIQFILKYGEPSEMELIMKQLEAINEQLKKIEAAIEQGFAELIEHLDFQQFRQEVKIPLRKLYDYYIRCFTVRGKVPMEDFKQQCRETKPQAIFSTMHEFLDVKKNIFETHLKSKKYVYSVYDEWSNVFFNYATKLVVINMFYYGIICAEHKAAGNKEPLINEEDEIADLINKIVRMDQRLKAIEEERIKSFHTGGHAKDFLREHFKKVVFNRGSYVDPLPPDTLAKIARQMKVLWKDFNGPSDYYIMVVRGTYGREGDYKFQRHAGWHIGDAGKVTVVENIAESSRNSSTDSICLALIQPVTKEMREVNAKVYKDHKEKVKEVVAHANSHEYEAFLPSNSLDKIKKFLPAIPFKPLLIMYNTEYSLYQSVNENIQIRPINYEMTSEAWSSAGGPLPPKYFWSNNVQAILLREVQIVFE